MKSSAASSIARCDNCGTAGDGGVCATEVVDGAGGGIVTPPTSASGRSATAIGTVVVSPMLVVLRSETEISTALARTGSATIFAPPSSGLLDVDGERERINSE